MTPGTHTSCVTDTPFGVLELSSSSGWLVQVRWTRKQPVPSAPHDRTLRSVVDQIQRFAAGELRRFELPLRLDGITEFQRRILDTLTDTVGFGETITYGELAARAGRPGAARAVGTALNRNPLPIIVPCHRVLASNGIGGFGPGLERKRQLLSHEGIAC